MAIMAQSNLGGTAEVSGERRDIDKRRGAFLGIKVLPIHMACKEEGRSIHKLMLESKSGVEKEEAARACTVEDRGGHADDDAVFVMRAGMFNLHTGAKG